MLIIFAQECQAQLHYLSQLLPLMNQLAERCSLASGSLVELFFEFAMVHAILFEQEWLDIGLYDCPFLIQKLPHFSPASVTSFHCTASLHKHQVKPTDSWRSFAHVNLHRIPCSTFALLYVLLIHIAGIPSRRSRRTNCRCCVQSSTWKMPDLALVSCRQSPTMPTSVRQPVLNLRPVSKLSWTMLV